MTEQSKDAKYIITEDQLKRFENGGYFDVVLREIRSHPAPESCDDTCIYKRFSKNMENAEKHGEQVRIEVLDDIAQWIQKHNYPQSSREHAPFVVTMMPLIEFIQSMRKGAP